MKPERKQQPMQALLKKMTQAKGDPDAAADIVDSALIAGLPREEALDDIIRCFLSFRDSFKEGAFPARVPFSQLIEAFRKVVDRKKIDLDVFYRTLLERMVLEGEHDEGSRGLPKYSTKDRILEAALGIFSEKGFHLATVDEIAERAGVGKGTLYRYFSNKETLFNELVRLRLETLETKANAVLDGQDDVLTMIGKYLRVYLEFFDHNQRLYRLIVQERQDVGAQIQDLYIKKVMRRIPLLKRKIYEASQQGLLKDVDFQTVFYGVMGFVHGVIQKWMACDCAYSLVEELPTVMEVLFYGFVKSNHQSRTNQEERNGQECCREQSYRHHYQSVGS